MTRHSALRVLHFVSACFEGSKMVSTVVGKLLLFFGFWVLFI